MQGRRPQLTRVLPRGRRDGLTQQRHHNQEQAARQTRRPQQPQPGYAAGPHDHQLAVGSQTPQAQQRAQQRRRRQHFENGAGRAQGDKRRCLPQSVIAAHIVELADELDKRAQAQQDEQHHHHGAQNAAHDVAVQEIHAAATSGAPLRLRCQVPAWRISKMTPAPANRACTHHKPSQSGTTPPSIQTRATARRLL